MSSTPSGSCARGKGISRHDTIGRKEMHIEASFDNTGHAALQSLGIDDGDGIILREDHLRPGQGGPTRTIRPSACRPLSVPRRQPR
ncbi:MAG: hypothetical protein M0C28_16815 [Candidatus Moduliflexus flocculans]|nr:hypothetical protein [Candidatus Moduliflexus flocculans]